MTFPIHLQKQIPVQKFEIYLPKFLQNKKILVTVFTKTKNSRYIFHNIPSKQNIPVTHLQK